MPIIKKPSSFCNTVLQTISVVVIPLFLVVALFDIYTIQQQRTILRLSHYGTLSAYQSQFDDTLRITKDFLSDATTNSLDFESIIYAKTKSEAYLAAQDIAAECRLYLKAYELLGGFCIYSRNFDSYMITYSGSYSLADQAVLREAVVSVSEKKYAASGFIPLTFSDRTVLLYTYVRNETVLAAMVDSSRQTYSEMSPDDRIFCAMPDGTPFFPASIFNADHIPIPQEQNIVAFQVENGEKFDLTALPFSQAEGYIVYASPSVSMIKMLNTTQRILLIITLGLLASIPICWLSLRRFILEPLNTLTRTMQAIQGGDTQIRVPQESGILEVNEISSTVNTMLDTIRQQKIDFYEQQLETQQAQLQYLNMQVRPHFFLNCLNVIYSMAGEKKYADIQELILDLSVYLRTTFKNNAKLVPLEEEIRSVSSYIRIQQLGYEQPPQVEFEIDSDISQASIPPLSILTFVENAIKHSTLVDSHLKIRIKCKKLSSEDGIYLNISIRDNGSGFSPNMLESLNQSSGEVYHNQHVGISNIKQRLRILYKGEATLYFQNLAKGACVELFLPLDAKNSGGNKA